MLSQSSIHTCSGYRRQNLLNRAFPLEASFICERPGESARLPELSHLVGGHGGVVFHPLLHDLHDGAEDFGVGRLLDQRGEDDLDEVLPHLHAHDGQPGLHQVQTQHYQLAGHYGDTHRLQLTSKKETRIKCYNFCKANNNDCFL